MRETKHRVFKTALLLLLLVHKTAAFINGASTWNLPAFTPTSNIQFQYFPHLQGDYSEIWFNFCCYLESSSTTVLACHQKARCAFLWGWIDWQGGTPFPSVPFSQHPQGYHILLHAVQFLFAFVKTICGQLKGWWSRKATGDAQNIAVSSRPIKHHFLCKMCIFCIIISSLGNVFTG